MQMAYLNTYIHVYKYDSYKRRTVALRLQYIAIYITKFKYKLPINILPNCYEVDTAENSNNSVTTNGRLSLIILPT